MVRDQEESWNDLDDQKQNSLNTRCERRATRVSLAPCEEDKDSQWQHRHDFLGDKPPLCHKAQ